MNIDWNRTYRHYSIEMPETNKHSACPFCGGKDRFRMGIEQDHLPWICNNCQDEGGDGFSYAARWLAREKAEMFKEIVNLEFNNTMIRHHTSDIIHQEEWNKNKNKMANYAKTFTGINNTPVVNYLNSRGINNIPNNFTMNTHAGQREFGTFWLPKHHNDVGAMVHKVYEPRYKRVSQFHYTLLDQSGNKANSDYQDKLFSGKYHELEKDSFRFAPLDNSGDWKYIIIGEGIESTLSVRQMVLQHDSIKPIVISTINAGMMKRFDLFWNPSPDTRFMIYADQDESGTGQESALKCKMNLIKRGVPMNNIQIYLPDSNEKDWNDILVEGNAQEQIRLLSTPCG